MKSKELSEAIKWLAEKATKGPFAVNPLSAYIDCTQLDEDGDPTPIAALAWPTHYRSEDETQANGELIALLLTERDAIIAALELVDVQRGPENGVNCSDCGCRLPANYTSVCPDCGCGDTSIQSLKGQTNAITG